MISASMCKGASCRATAMVLFSRRMCPSLPVERQQDEKKHMDKSAAKTYLRNGANRCGEMDHKAWTRVSEQAINSGTQDRGKSRK